MIRDREEDHPLPLRIGAVVYRFARRYHFPTFQVFVYVLTYVCMYLNKISLNKYVHTVFKIFFKKKLKKINCA